MCGHSEFLIYFENVKKKERGADREGHRARCVHTSLCVGVASDLACRSLENQVLRDGDRDMYIKQTYSVLRLDVNQDEGPAGAAEPGSSSGAGAGAPGSADKKDVKKKPRKWHLSESPAMMPTQLR